MLVSLSELVVFLPQWLVLGKTLSLLKIYASWDYGIWWQTQRLMTAEDDSLTVLGRLQVRINLTKHNKWAVYFEAMILVDTFIGKMFSMVVPVGSLIITRCGQAKPVRIFQESSTDARIAGIQARLLQPAYHTEHRPRPWKKKLAICRLTTIRLICFWERK